VTHNSRTPGESTLSHTTLNFKVNNCDEHGPPLDAECKVSAWTKYALSQERSFLQQRLLQIASKLCCVAYKVLTTFQPTCLHNLLSSQYSIIVLCPDYLHRRLDITDRSVPCAAPHFWSQLSESTCESIHNPHLCFTFSSPFIRVTSWTPALSLLLIVCCQSVLYLSVTLVYCG